MASPPPPICEVLILLRFATTGHHSGRARARRCMQAFLEGTLQAENDGASFELQPTDEVQQECDHMEAEDTGSCKCLADLQGCRHAVGEHLTLQLEELLLLLMQRRECGAATAWLRSLLVALDRIIEDTAGDRLQSDLTQVFGLHSVGASGTRKRRPDQDFRQLVTQNALQEKRAKTTGDMLVATGDFGRKTGAKFVDRQLREYLTTAHLELPRSTHLSVVCDGARLGNPAKDNLVIAAVTMEGVGFWLPQQALSR